MPPDDLSRLGAIVRARRNELDLTQREAAVTAGVSDQTWLNVEQGMKVRERTHARVERALRWEPGSIAKVLAGGEPTPADSTPPADLATLVAELQDRLAVIEEQLGIRRQLDQAEIDERAARNKARRAARRTAAAQPQ